jgi:hypothetical protein
MIAGYKMFALTMNDITVELEDIGEGLSGDYDPEDKDDVSLLRFTVLKDDEPVEDASYCTQVPTNVTITEATKILGAIMNEVAEPLEQGYSIKKMCERISWIDKEANY